MWYSDNYFTINTEDKAKEFGLAIIKAVKKTHTIANKCKKLTEELDVAKKCDDKDYMVYVLQKYINQYKNLLEKRNMIRICLISRQEYNKLNIEYWIEQLNIMKQFIYLFEAQKSIEKETIKQCLKKILTLNGKFTREEIDKYF